MADYEDTKVNDLIINNMSQEKFDELKAAGELDPTQLYCTPEEGGSALPDQTDNAGALLTTDGTNPQWTGFVGVTQRAGSAAVILDPRGVQVSSYKGDTFSRVAINPNGDTSNLATNIMGRASDQSVTIGYGTIGGSYAVAVGALAQASSMYSISIGYGAVTAASYAIQLGKGTNSTANTFSVALSITNNYRLLEADGTIPLDRLTGVAKQFSELPSAEVYSGKIVQYTGTANTHGAFYEAVSETIQELNASGYRLDSSVSITLAVDKEKFLAQSPLFNEGYGNVWRADYTGVEWNVWTQDPNITISAADLESVWGITITSSAGAYTPEAGDSIQVMLMEETTHEWKEIKFGETLPDQTGNAGKFLMTDGTTTSWGKALVDSGSDGLGITRNGEQIYVSASSVSVGNYSSAPSFRGSALGNGSKASSAGATAIGYNAEVEGYANYSSVAIGHYAVVGTPNAVHICSSSSQTRVRYLVENSFGWSNNNGTYTLFDANGNIPVDRLGKVVEVLPEESNNFTTVKNFGKDYVEITGFSYIGIVGAGTGSEIVIDLPEGYNMRDGNYWVNVSCTSESPMFDFKAEVKSRNTNSFFVAYKNEDDTNGLEGAGIFWEVRGMLVSTGA